MSKGNTNAESETDLIARNKKARFDYKVLDTFEAGMALLGSEVKSLRNRDVSLAEAFVRPRGRELWLLGANIKPYRQATIVNHDPVRPRKLLLHRREIDRLGSLVAEKGLTIVPIEMYWKNGIAKVRIAVARGKRRFDKRESIRKREARREIRRAEGRSRRG